MTLEVLTCDAIETPHGFFTRNGGASSGVFSSLNCGFGSSDQTDMVAINRARVAEKLGMDANALVTVHQHHSADVVAIDGPLTSSIKADAMVTATPGVALGIMTADCQPVLFADKTAGVVGGAHAGWKGALGGILEATVDAMEALGASKNNITAAIGPSISQKAYEVGPEFLDTFLAEDDTSARFFANGQGDRYQFDLIGYGLKRLRDTGISHAEWTGHCTYSDPDRFFSYRRSIHEKQADYGRLISVIAI
jgi:YfiH family protein